MNSSTMLHPAAESRTRAIGRTNKTSFAFPSSSPLPLRTANVTLFRFPRLRDTRRTWKTAPKRGESEENIVIHIKHPFPSFGAVVLACGWKMVGRSRHYSPTGPPSFSRMFFYPISASPTPIYVLFQFPDSFLYSRFHRKRKVQASSLLALLSEAETLAGGCTSQ